jgi:hypothetical protein
VRGQKTYSRLGSFVLRQPIDDVYLHLMSAKFRAALNISCHQIFLRHLFENFLNLDNVKVNFEPHSRAQTRACLQAPRLCRLLAPTLTPGSQPSVFRRVFFWPPAVPDLQLLFFFRSFPSHVTTPRCFAQLPRTRRAQTLFLLLSSSFPDHSRFLRWGRRR